MPPLAATPLEPRKSPVQARSAASVDAILEATVQVLVSTGKERLTTTRVAERAGVSVGTLYQYFPNKSSLLQAVLNRHLDSVVAAVEAVCEAQKGAGLASMATALVHAFLAAKMKDPQTSVALYAVSSDVDGIRLARQVGIQIHKAVAAMLSTATDARLRDPDLVANVVQGALTGISRRLLESENPDLNLPSLQAELTTMLCAYLKQCAAQR